MPTDLELAADHEYVVEPGGKAKVSVSKIAGLLDDGKTDGLMRWARNLATQGIDYETARNDKADLGTRVHDHFLSWNKGESVNALPDEIGFLDGIEKWKIESGAESIEHEQIVISSRGFGGRFDDVSVIRDEIWGIDLKTGSLHDRSVELQHAGYWNSDGIAVYDNAGYLIGTRPLPAVTRWACLNPHADGTYDFVEYPKRRRGQKNIPIEALQEAAWDKFCKLLDVYGWLHPTKAAA